MEQQATAAVVEQMETEQQQQQPAPEQEQTAAAAARTLHLNAGQFVEDLHRVVSEGRVMAAATAAADGATACCRLGDRPPAGWHRACSCSPHPLNTPYNFMQVGICCNNIFDNLDRCAAAWTGRQNGGGLDTAADTTERSTPRLLLACCRQCISCVSDQRGWWIAYGSLYTHCVCSSFRENYGPRLTAEQRKEYLDGSMQVCAPWVAGWDYGVGWVLFSCRWTQSNVKQAAQQHEWAG